MMYLDLLAVGVLPLTLTLQLVRPGLYHSLLQCLNLLFKSISESSDLELTERTSVLFHCTMIKGRLCWDNNYLATVKHLGIR